MRPLQDLGNHRGVVGGVFHDPEAYWLRLVQNKERKGSCCLVIKKRDLPTACDASVRNIQSEERETQQILGENIKRVVEGRPLSAE